MARGRIDTERTSARVTFSPGIPSLGITVRGLSGEFDLTLGDDDRPDMRIPVRGEFAPPPATRHPPAATRHPPPATRHPKP